MSKWEEIEIEIPKETHNQASDLVEIGLFNTVEDALQFAVVAFLRSHGMPDFKLQRN